MTRVSNKKAAIFSPAINFLSEKKENKGKKKKTRNSFSLLLLHSLQIIGFRRKKEVFSLFFSKLLLYRC